MKALSLRQPWATLVIQGKKTLELRAWTVNYRGRLAIHASQTYDPAACRALGVTPETVTTGAVLGTVELTAIFELDEAAYQERQAQHLASGYFSKKPEETLYGWEIANPVELPQAIPFPGRMGLFNVPDDLLQGEGEADVERPLEVQGPVEWDARQAFELRVIPEGERLPLKGGQRPAAYRLALYQRFVEPPPLQPRLTPTAPLRMRLIAELSGSLLKAVADQVLEALRLNSYSATDLSPARREPFYLNEESGVRLGLLFLAVRPLAKMNRVEMISLGIRAMTSEELYYWFSKCINAPSAERAQKALRILLSDE